MSDSVQTAAKEMVQEATAVREHQTELLQTLRERDHAVQREVVDLVVAALDDVVGGVGGRQKRKLAKDLDDAVTSRRSRPIEAPGGRAEAPTGEGRGPHTA